MQVHSFFAEIMTLIKTKKCIEYLKMDIYQEKKKNPTIISSLSFTVMTPFVISRSNTSRSPDLMLIFSLNLILFVSRSSILSSSSLFLSLCKRNTMSYIFFKMKSCLPRGIYVYLVTQIIHTFAETASDEKH